MNRTALGLAMGAGYVLGRGKRMKLALLVGAVAAGKRPPLGPKAVRDLVTRQLQDNPRLKEAGDQLRGDVGGLGKAVSAGLVERRMRGLAEGLSQRTEGIRGRMAEAAQPGTADGQETDEETDRGGAGPEAGEPEEEETEEEPEAEAAGEEPEAEDTGSEDAGGRRAERPRPPRPPRKPAKKATRRAPAAKAPAGKTAARKPAGKKPAANRGSARRPAGSQHSKGSGDHD